MLLSEAPEVYGLELLRAADIKSGTAYPLLDRLEEAGWVTSRWEDVDPVEMGRPRRRFYSLTADGTYEAQRTLMEHGVEAGTLRWA